MTTELMDAPTAVAQQAGALAPQQQRPLTVIEHAMRAGASATELREILALQRDLDNHQLALMREKRSMDEEDRKRDALLAFRRDFAALRGENIVVPKSKYVDRGKAGSFMQAEYGRIAGMLSPALSKHGFGFRHDVVFGSRLWTTDGVENSVGWVYVTCHLEHRDGHAEKLDLEGPPGDLHANTVTQNMQATASYLKRQSLLAITGTATEEEDDENNLGSSTGGPQKSQRRQPDDLPDGERQALIDAGHGKATQGMKALTVWWAALTEAQRKSITPEFGAMRQGARQFDEKVR